MFAVMTPRTVLTAGDRSEAIRMALSGIASALEVATILSRLEPLHPPHDTFPGEVFLELAVDAIEASGASRAARIECAGIRERYPGVPRPHEGAASQERVRDSGGGDDPRWCRSGPLGRGQLVADRRPVDVGAGRSRGLGARGG